MTVSQSKQQRSTTCLFQKYGEWQEVRLRFDEINQKAHAQLDVSQWPVATNAVMQAIHKASDNTYKDKALHVSF